MPAKTKTSKSASAAAGSIAEKVVVAAPSPQQVGVAASNVDQAQVLKAFRALAAHVERRNGATSAAAAASSSSLPLDGPQGNLRDPSNAVYLQMTLNTLRPTSHVKPVRINVPHALHTPGSTSVCLLVKDPQREYKDLLVEHRIKCISRVVGVAKLKGKFKPFDARRALVQDHDLFLADSRIVPTLPNLCGKVFFDAKKNPITVNLQKTGEGFKSELEAAIKATTYVQNKGSCTTVKIGYLASHSPEQLTDNLLAALPAILSRVKGGWENVHNLDVKTGNSAALPIWNAKLGIKSHVSASTNLVPSTQSTSAKTKSAESKSKAEAKDEAKDEVQLTEVRSKDPSPRKTRAAAAKAIAKDAAPSPKKLATQTKKSTSSATRSARKTK